MKSNHISQDKRECSEKTGIVFNVAALTSGLETLSSHLCSCTQSPIGAASHGPCKIPLRLGEMKALYLGTFIKRVVTLQIP